MEDTITSIHCWLDRILVDTTIKWSMMQMEVVTAYQIILHNNRMEDTTIRQCFSRLSPGKELPATFPSFSFTEAKRNT